jgi:hypothetical protein
LYDAARKALNAVLENQGLRATSRGGHIAVLDAVSAQLDPPLGSVLRPFDRMRRRRNQAEYPAADSPGLSAEDVERDLPKVQAIIETVVKVLDQMSPFEVERVRGIELALSAWELATDHSGGALTRSSRGKRFGHPPVAASGSPLRTVATGT